MVRRLATSLRRVDRILQNGLFTVQPGFHERRQLLSLSSVSSTNYLAKGLHKCAGLKKINKGTTNVGEKTEIAKSAENVSSLSLRSFAPKAPIQGSGFGGDGGRGRNGIKVLDRPGVDEKVIAKKIARAVIISIVVLLGFVRVWRLF